jgi:hypothetical protein
MTDHRDTDDEPTPAELATIGSLLARPDLWDEPPAGLHTEVLLAIAEAAAPTGGAAGVAIPLDVARKVRSRLRNRWWMGAAAACALVVIGLAIAARDGTRSVTTIELAGTAAAPGASADVELSATPAGLRIVLDATGLRGAPPGYFYEAWVSDGSTRVSAGTFHLRGGDGPIELWAGVTDPAFTTLSVTLEPVDGDTDTSGDVRLVGQFELVDD